MRRGLGPVVPCLVYVSIINFIATSSQKAKNVIIRFSANTAWVAVTL